MTFVAIDFETANPCFASVCQIGVVAFNDACHVDKWQTLINPQDYFAPTNIRVHGIEPDHVKDSPTFPDVYDKLKALLTGQIVVHHSHFDRAVFYQVRRKHGLADVECRWLDTTEVLREVWPEFSERGYNLPNVARQLGIEFRHHSADEDARATGEILLKAIQHSGTPLTDWLTRIWEPMTYPDMMPYSENGEPRRSRTSYRHADCKRTGNPNGPLAGETLVFTGELSMPRERAADLAAEAGCNVGQSVTKKTTLLVVGDQDIRVLAGHVKSSKHRKAEALIEEGQSIRILGESDFLFLIGKQAEA
jgi:DNA polymerase-3 subunit epsilon